MKNKWFIIVVSLVLIIGIIGFILWNNRVVSTITIDINPSIEINLDKNKNVKSVKALNEDAKDVVSDNLKGKSLDDALKVITNNVIDKGYTEDKQVVILLHSSGNIIKEDVKRLVENTFNEKGIYSDIIVVNNITKEDKVLAKENNISSAKAAYINSIIEKNENINSEDLVEKPIRELEETKNTGKYCEKGYSLEGDFCLKEINRKEASSGLTCKDGYYEYNGKCYEETGIEETDNLVCREEFILKEDKCVRTIKDNAKPDKYTCNKGEAKTMLELGLSRENDGNANDVVCVDYSKATHPVTPCELPANDPTERMSSGGKCYWHRAPVIAEGCPGKIQVKGFCWDDATNIYICVGYRDGKQYKSKDEYCEHSIKYLDPTITEYKCEDGFMLNGKSCEKEEIEDAMHEFVCKSGYTLVNKDRCINLNKSIQKENGYICKEENSKVVGNMCVIYDIVEAKRN